MFIIDDIWNWFLGKVLEKYFGKYFNKNDEIIVLYENRIKELKGELTDEKLKITKSYLEKEHILQSLKNRGISIKRLIEKYDQPLNAILISYATQVEEKKKGSFTECKFIKEELEKYSVKGLGATDFLIPPAKIPPNIKNSESLKDWFEKNILKGRFCKIKFLVLIDIRNKSYWANYVPYKQKKPFHHTIGEVLEIEDVFTEKQISRIALQNLITDGDISWLASSTLTESELDVVCKNQKVIEDNLNNPNLRQIADDSIICQLSNALSPFLDDHLDVAKKIVNEAKFWSEKLFLN